jgi:hypothetical protein
MGKSEGASLDILSAALDIVLLKTVRVGMLSVPTIKEVACKITG